MTASRTVVTADKFTLALTSPCLALPHRFGASVAVAKKWFFVIPVPKREEAYDHALHHGKSAPRRLGCLDAPRQQRTWVISRGERPVNGERRLSAFTVSAGAGNLSRAASISFEMLHQIGGNSHFYTPGDESLRWSHQWSVSRLLLGISRFWWKPHLVPAHLAYARSASERVKPMTVTMLTT